jgi:translation initiation factor 1
MSRERGTVYSSEHGRMCPHCGLPAKRCVCRANPRGTREPAPSDGVVRVRREKKGRGGKVVTTIRGIPLPAAELRDLAKELRRHCGSGGTVKQGVVEIQGDHLESLLALLGERGYRAVQAGG